MPKRVFRRLVPLAQDFLRDRNVRRLFGELLLQPNLWHLNRSSVSLAVSVGVFLAFVPVPGQTILAAAAAILVGCNLPIAVVFVWVSNPFTMPPMYFACYKFGAWLLGEQSRAIRFEISFEWAMTTLVEIWQPLLLGCFVLGLLSALIGNLGVRLIWRIHVASSWRERRRRRMSRTVSLRGGQLRPEAPEEDDERR